MRVFAKALAMNAGDMSCSSPGAAPEEYVEHANLDSVIFLNDTTAVMITRRTYGRKFYCFQKWKPGADTVYNHPLFTKKHDLKGIKKALERDYYFVNPIDSVKFLGYDNGESRKPKENKENRDSMVEIKPSVTIGPPEKDKPKHIPLAWMVTGLALVSLAGGLILSRFFGPN